MSVTLTNASRFWTPLWTAILLVVMFAPPIAVGFTQTGFRVPALIGTLVFAASAAHFARAAWLAPVSLTIDGDALVVGRPRGRRDRFGAARVRRWTFTVPDGPPTQAPPATNALLVVAFDEGTTFRGEATADESRAFASWFDRHLSAPA